VFGKTPLEKNEKGQKGDVTGEGRLKERTMRVRWEGKKHVFLP